MAQIKTIDELEYIRQNLIEIDGFSVEISTDSEYFRLMFKNTIICGDSANADLYDTEIALGIFNSILEEIPPNWVGVVGAAIDKGFAVIPNYNIWDTLADAEAFLIEHTDKEEITAEVVPDFWQHKNYLEYWDDKNICCLDISGEIVAQDWHNWKYYRLAGDKATPAGWWESDNEDVYVFLSYVVTSQGEVKMLLG